MERAEESAKAMNPTRVFLILAGVLAALATFVFLTRSSPPPASTGETDAPNFSLTDQEALNRFLELDEVRVNALRSRDISLLHEAFVEGPAYRRLSRSINRLKEQRVFFRSDYARQSVSVISNTEEEIRVRVVENVDPKFISQTGEDLTQGVPEQHTTIWVLRQEQGTWRIYDGILTHVEKI